MGATAKPPEPVNGQDERAMPAVDHCRLFRFLADRAVKPRVLNRPLS